MSDSGEQRNVVYDDVASQVFAVAVLALYCIPVTLLRIRRWIWPVSRVGKAGGWKGKGPDYCRCRECVVREEKIERDSRRWYNTWGTPWNAVFVMTWVALLVFMWTMYHSGHKMEQPFDPFQVLELSRHATDKEIRRAYLKMSVKHHPDKNIGDSEAEEKFVKITKAYEALTDELAKENYRKYGNPDGFKGTEFGVALPSWLITWGNSVLMIYLVGIIVVFPICVALWWRKRANKMSNGALYSTCTTYYRSGMHLKRFADVLTAFSSAHEFQPYMKRELGPKFGELGMNLKKLEIFDLRKAKFVVQLEDFMAFSTILINAYVARADIPRELKPTLDDVLGHTEKLCGVLAEGAIGSIRPEFRNTYRTQPCMNGYISRLLIAINISQCLCQALLDKDSPLLQLPHFTPKEVKYCSSKSVNVKSIYEFRSLDVERRRFILRSFSEEEFLDVNEFCLRYPEVSIEASDPYVEGEEDQTVHESDAAVVKVKLSVHRQTGNARSPCVRHLPIRKSEIWWLILGDCSGNRDLVLDVKRLTPDDADEDGNYSATLKFLAPVRGRYTYVVHALCDCYVGCDRFKQFKFDVLDAATPQETPRYFDTSEESEEEGMDDDEEEEEDDDQEDEDGDEEYVEDENEFDEDYESREE